ncbi:MAG: hypothetical protein DUD39_01150 [Coriobacteriaceae bacterium]|nr:MAG: hypothetical protein DUD39_01150 [Coriobacteriaceae bacterium]
MAGVSTKRIQEVSEILWGLSVSPATLLKLMREAFGAVDEWRRRPLTGKYPLRLAGRHVREEKLGRLLRRCGCGHRHPTPGAFRKVIGCKETSYMKSRPD